MEGDFKIWSKALHGNQKKRLLDLSKQPNELEVQGKSTWEEQKPA